MRRRNAILATRPIVDYFRLTAEEDDITFTITKGSGVTTTYLKYFEYSIDEGNTWTRVNGSSSTITTTISGIALGDSVLLRGSGTQTSTTSTSNVAAQRTIITATGNFSASGVLTTLLYGKHANSDTQIQNNWTFACLFYNSTKLVDAYNLIMPPNVKSRCFSSMFNGCTALKRAPELPATTLAQQCYISMFYNCSALIYIKMMATDISASGCLTTWIPSSLVNLEFYRNPNATWWVTGNNGIPERCVLFDDNENIAEEETFIDSEVQRLAILNFGNRKPQTLTINGVQEPCWKGKIRIGGVDGKILKKQVANIVQIYCQFANNPNIIDCSDFNKFINLTKFIFTNSSTTVNGVQLKHSGFYNCTALKYVTLPSTMTSLCGAYTYGLGCFMNTAIETITIPNSVTTASDYLFCGCTQLKSVTWGSSLSVKVNTTSYYNGVFYDCSNLETINNFPQTATAIANSYFRNCSKLDMTPIIPLLNIITTLESYAFGGCANTNLPNELVFNNVTNDVNHMTNGLGRRKLYFPKKTTMTQYTFSGNTAELIDIGNVTGSYFYPGNGNSSSNTVTVILRSTTMPTFSTFNKTNVRRIYVYDSILNDFKTNSKTSSAASITFAIGGAEWEAEFGSSDEWADYPNGTSPFNE